MPIHESAWVNIVKVELDDFADSLLDGQEVVLQLSQGNSCSWGQFIDPGTGRSLAEDFAIEHFHGRVTFGHGSRAAAGSQIGIALIETTT